MNRRNTRFSGFADEMVNLCAVRLSRRVLRADPTRDHSTAWYASFILLFGPQEKKKASKDVFICEKRV